ncbi:MAG TPA: T9SS type A sorting domain-containing protein, partial [Bacteroidia bacterium]|nr:T9SS type A sorting domain-containing protein [Bacteroidia bacterium]
THTSGGTAPSAPGSGTRSWSFNWVAPAAGTGAVTFYGAFLGGNNNGSESGDLTYKTTTIVNEASPCTVTAAITSSADTICPQDSAILTATGGVSYLWSNGATTATIKVPAGTYTVTATAAAGCTGSKSKTIVSRASVAPTGLNASNVFGVSVKIGWTKSTCATGYKIMYHPINTATWKTATVADTNAKTISALTPLTTYEYKMASVYGTLVSAYGTVKTFTTLCNCSLPALTVSVTSNSTTNISWVDESCSVKHKVQYRKLGATAWISKIVYDSTGVTNQLLSGLTPNTTYQYRTRSECNLAGTFNSGWTGISTFATPLRLGSSVTEGFTIYPNPTEGIINLSGANAGTLRIFDMLGQQVFEQVIEASAETRTIDLSSLAKGMYLVQMQSEEGTFTDKIQIMK